MQATEKRSVFTQVSSISATHIVDLQHLPKPKAPNPEEMLEDEEAAGQGEEEEAAAAAGRGKEGCPKGGAVAAEEEGKA